MSLKRSERTSTYRKRNVTAAPRGKADANSVMYCEREGEVLI